MAATEREREQRKVLSQRGADEARIKDGAVWGLTPLCLNSGAEKEGRL